MIENQGNNKNSETWTAADNNDDDDDDDIIIIIIIITLVWRTCECMKNVEVKELSKIQVWWQVDRS